MRQRRYNIALACARADNGKPNFVEPVTKAELATRRRGVMSEALYSLPDNVFDDAVRVLATFAARIDFWRHDCEDDSMFSTLDDLRAVAQKHSVLGHVADAIERIEMERARELAKALDDPWLNAVQAGHSEALRMIPTAPAAPSSPPTCNKHIDCDAADAAAQAKGERGAVHCHDDCCEDCFGS